MVRGGCTTLLLAAQSAVSLHVAVSPTWNQQAAASIGRTHSQPAMTATLDNSGWLQQQTTMGDEPLLSPISTSSYREYSHMGFLPPMTARLISGRFRQVLSFVLAYLESRPRLSGARVMISGGYVRDILLGRTSDDLDLTLDLRACDPDVTVDLVAEGLPAFAAEHKSGLHGVEAVEIVTALSSASRSKAVDAAQVRLRIGEEDVLLDLMPTIAREIYDAHDRIPRREGRGTAEQDTLRRDLTIGAMLLEVERAPEFAGVEAVLACGSSEDAFGGGDYTTAADGAAAAAATSPPNMTWIEALSPADGAISDAISEAISGIDTASHTGKDGRAWMDLIASTRRARLEGFTVEGAADSNDDNDDDNVEGFRREFGFSSSPSASLSSSSSTTTTTTTTTTSSSSSSSSSRLPLFTLTVSLLLFLALSLLRVFEVHLQPDSCERIPGRLHSTTGTPTGQHREVTRRTARGAHGEAHKETESLHVIHLSPPQIDFEYTHPPPPHPSTSIPHMWRAVCILYK